MFRREGGGAGNHFPDCADLFQRGDQQTRFNPEYVVAIAVPDRDIAVSVIEFIENFLHILLLQPAGQFLVIGDAGVLEGLLERNILIPVLVFIFGPVISEFAVQIPDDAAIQPHQSRDNFEGGTRRKTIFGKGAVSVDADLRIAGEYRDERVRRMERGRHFSSRKSGLRQLQRSRRKKIDANDFRIFIPVISVCSLLFGALCCKRGNFLLKFSTKIPIWRPSQTAWWT